MLITIFTKASSYSLTWDEKLQDDYGKSALKWYKSYGRDTAIFNYSPDIHINNHGPFFEELVAEGEVKFGNSYHVRAAITGMSAVLGVIAIGLCGYEIGGYWLAFIVSFALWIYPRFYGSMFNNSKDIPFASFNTLILLAIIHLLKQWNKKYILNSVFIGVTLGMAIAIRINAVIWYPVLLFIPCLWWALNFKSAKQRKTILHDLRKQATALLITFIVSGITVCALWPYIFINPIHNFIESIKVIQQYPWIGNDVLGGKLYNTEHLPWFFVPVWLIVMSPLIIIPFFAAGLIEPVFKMLKTRKVDFIILACFLAFFVPLAAIIFSHSTLYSGPRQFFFLVPPMVLIAGYGFFTFYHYLYLKKKYLLAALLIVIGGINYSLVIIGMSRLYPYEYTYFNSLVGGLKGANGKYDTDYWATCTKASAEWLGKNYKTYTKSSAPSYSSQASLIQTMLYLPSNFVRDDNNPEFFISPIMHPLDQEFPSYKIIHKEGVEGVPFCVIKSRQ